VLMHIGLDTINLKGKGFTPRIKLGDHVCTGDPLIEFDADYLATQAKSLLTPVAAWAAADAGRTHAAQSPGVHPARRQVRPITQARPGLHIASRQTSRNRLRAPA
jgi:phosphotransferase system IIA component